MFDHNDPRLTAYVLGELTEDENREVEQAIAASPELQETVADLRKAVDLLGAALASEPSPELESGQRAAIEAAAVGPADRGLADSGLADGASDDASVPSSQQSLESKSVSVGGWPLYRTLLVTVAASLFVAVLGLTAWMMRDRVRPVALPAVNGQGTPSETSSIDLEFSDHSKDRNEMVSGPASSSAQPEPRQYDQPSDEYAMGMGSPGISTGGFANGPSADGGAREAGGYGYGEGDRTVVAPPGVSAGPAGYSGSERANYSIPAPGGSPFPAGGSLPSAANGNVPMEDSEEALGGIPLPAKPQSTAPVAGGASPRPSVRLSNGGSASGLSPSRFRSEVEERMGQMPDRLVEEAEELQQASGRSPGSPGAPGSAGGDSGGAAFERSLPESRLSDLSAVAGDSKGKSRVPGDDGADGRMRPGSDSLRSGLGDRPSRPADDTIADRPFGGDRPSGGDGAGDDSERAADPFGREREGDGDESRPSIVPADETKNVDDALADVDGKSEGEKSGKEDEKKNANRSWRRDRVHPNTTRLMVGDNTSLPLEGMQVNVVVDGFRARVLLDCYYLNTESSQLEGSFQLRLPNEASLYYFAFGETSFQYRPKVDQLASRGFLPADLLRSSGTGLDGIRAARSETWVNVKEARLVPRPKAAHAYSEVVRRRVDPALVEWSGAGVFEAKVFPLQPSKLHRIVIGYDVSLERQGDDLVYSLPLPDVSQVAVDLDIAAVPGLSAKVSPSVQPFVTNGRAFYHFEKPEGGSVDVRLNAPGNVLLTGGDAEAGDFFASRFVPELPSEQRSSSSPNAIFLLDTSLSSRPEKFNVWLNLLEETLRRNQESMKQFAVLLFNIETHWWQDGYVENTPQNVDRVIEYCRTLSLEGATDVRQALEEATNPRWKDAKPESSPDLFILSDGAATWGERDAQQLLRTLRSGTGGTLFGYQTGLTGTDVATLEMLARESGGAVFSVTEENQVKEAATAHRQRPWKLINATVTGGSDILIAGRPRSIYPGQSLLLVGRGVPQGEVLLQLSQGGKTKEVRTALHRRVASKLTPRLYGQVATGQLEELAEVTADVSEAFARHFRITGRTCSLLMLESEADYQRFNIRPQDDLFVVQSTPVDELVARKLDELGGELGDPKSQLLQWLERLEQMPGFEFDVPPALRLAVERMPADAFDVPATRLECSRRDREQLSKSYFQWLSEQQLNYGVISEEAERRRREDGPVDALRAVSNLVERRPGDDVLLQDVAFTAIHWGLPGQAYPLLRRVAASRPHQPHVYLALGECLAEMGRADLALVYYEVAMNARWNARYQDVRDIAAVQYGHLLRRISSGELKTSVSQFVDARMNSLRGQQAFSKADVVVVMMWNTDRTDVDLHVQEPSGEECFYKNRSTRAGGRISRDVTEGFGPEMYWMGKASPGKYTVKANYYNTDANRLGLQTKVYVSVYRDYGSSAESVDRQIVALAGAKEKREVMSITVKP